MRLPIYLDDLRGNGRTIAIRHEANTVRLVAIDRDGFDAENDVSFVVADLSTALLRNALDVSEESAPTVTQSVPMNKRPGRRKPRWFRGF